MGMEENKLNDDELENVSGGIVYFCSNGNEYYVLDQDYNVIQKFYGGGAGYVWDFIDSICNSSSEITYDEWQEKLRGSAALPDNGGGNGAIAPR